MTNEEKNIKICEWLGWTKLPIPSTATWGCNAGEKFWYFSHELPNHFTDLNAMHKAEKSLPENKVVWYLQKLVQIKYQDDKIGGTIGCMIDRTVFATASQRADAFGKTLNLW